MPGANIAIFTMQIVHHKHVENFLQRRTCQKNASRKRTDCMVRMKLNLLKANRIDNA